MMNDDDITTLLRMAREADGMGAARARVAPRALGLAAGLALAASAAVLVLSRGAGQPTAVLPGPAAAEALGEPEGPGVSVGAEEGRVLLAIFRNGDEQPACVVHQDVGGAEGSALTRLSRSDLARLAGRCESEPMRVLLIELAGPARLLPATREDAGAIVACLDLAEDRQVDWGCAAAACVPPEVSVTTARVALAASR